MTFKSLGDVLKYIEDAASDTLNGSVVAEVGADFMMNAETDVYGAYDPHFYDRSYRLMQTSTYDVESKGNMKIEISVNHPQGKLIEYGHGEGGFYEYPFNSDDTAWKFLQPRPFYRHTVEQLANGRFKELVAQGLREHGINVH